MKLNLAVLEEPLEGVTPLYARVRGGVNMTARIGYGSSTFGWAIDLAGFVLPDTQTSEELIDSVGIWKMCCPMGVLITESAIERSSGPVMLEEEDFIALCLRVKPILDSMGFEKCALAIRNRPELHDGMYVFCGELIMRVERSHFKEMADFHKLAAAAAEAYMQVCDDKPEVATSSMPTVATAVSKKHLH